MGDPSLEDHRKTFFECHAIDPDGDVVLILSARQSNTTELPSPELKTGTQSEGEPATSTTAPSDAHESHSMKYTASTTPPSESRVRVSSKHLMLASSVFKAMIGNGFREGADLSPSGELRLPLLEDDSDALVILLDVVHGRLKKVPRQLDLGRLTKISILVDKYQLHEAVEMAAQVWINYLKSRIPTSYTQDLVPWICITWVFNRPNEFRSLTEIAEREIVCESEELVAEWLPIPTSIAASINRHRARAIYNVISILRMAEEDYEGVQTQCCRGKADCDSLTLGDWRRQLKSVELLNMPTYPFAGLQFSVLESSINSLENNTLCSVEGWSPSEHRNIGGIVKVAIKDVSLALRGLGLANFKGCKQ